MQDRLNFLEALIEDAPDLILTFDERGLVQTCNRAVESILAYTPGELIGKPAAEILGGPFREEFLGAFHAYLSRQERAFLESARRVQGLRKDGSLLPISYKVSELRGTDRRAFSMVVRDITKILDTERELESKTQALMDANAKLEHFNSIAAHDLKAPLRTITNFSTRLLERDKDARPPEETDYLKRIAAGAQRMQTLIDDLLTLSRVSAPPASFAAVDMNEIFDQIVDDLHATVLEVGAKVTRANLPKIHTAPSLARQLLQNLVANGIKFRRAGIPPEVHVEATETPDAWIFCVADNGIGIDSRYFERIFLLFHRLHGPKEYPGSGLGLAICKRIVDQLGGNLRVESEVGKGARFFFTLPKS